MSGVRYGSWHTLTIESVAWYCYPTPDACKSPEGWCVGHDASAPGREVEVDQSLDHPADCPVPPCCCTVSVEERHDGYPEIDPECEAGRHDACLNRGYRCHVEEGFHEWWSFSDMPTTPGAYRIRGWGSGPDHNGEYDAGIDWEPIGAAS